MSIADNELIAEFVIESQEGLAAVERQMLDIEAAGESVETDQVNAVFRTMHSIKGAAGFLGLDQIGKLAHRLEELLDHMRNRELTPTSELVTTMLSAADCMSGLIASVDTSNEADISNHVTALAKFLPGTRKQAEPPVQNGSPPTSPLPETPVANPTEAASAGAPLAEVDQSHAISEAVREFLIECYDNLEQMDRDLLTLEQSPDSPELLRSVFRTMHTIKGGAGMLGFHGLEQLGHAAENVLGKMRDGALKPTNAIVTVLLEAIDQCRIGLKRIENSGGDEFGAEATIQRLHSFVTGAPKTPTPNAAAPSVESPLAPPARQNEPTPPISSKAAPARAAAETSADKSGSALGESTIRVDVALLDKLMTRVGELVLARNQILQHLTKLDNAEFASTAQRLNHITSELQEGVMKTRMQPIGNVWSKFPRVVRDLASQLNKQARLDLEGKETELDKTIIEAIKDPLTHLVRNSVDHGIELPAARLAAGKPAEGRLLLRAYHEGGQVNIEIIDDGAGLNLTRIRKKAVENGLLTQEQANRLSDRDASLLIFSAGFSTAEQVTNVSGRGVGMDVVKTNIERISGVIDLETRPGLGTTIKIKIPLTLAIIPALIVTSGGDRYAIPQVSLLELVRIEQEDIAARVEFIQGAPVYRLRGKLLPLLFLSERLKLHSEATANQEALACRGPLNIVVVRADERQFGLIVDRVCDTEEIVVKPLGKQLKKIGEYAGATIMGDGGVALILDVKGVADAAGLGAEQRLLCSNRGHDDAASEQGDREAVLVVDVCDSRRFALPMTMISRLERVSFSIIEHANGQEVIQYRGSILPLVRLTAAVGGGDKQRESGELQLVVYSRNGLSYGLVVGEIVDTCDVRGLVISSQREPGAVIQSCVIQERVTDVIDLDYLGREFCSSFATAQLEECLA